jgi:hypothetical protein
MMRIERWSFIDDATILNLPASGFGIGWACPGDASTPVHWNCASDRGLARTRWSEARPR